MDFHVSSFSPVPVRNWDSEHKCNGSSHFHIFTHLSWLADATIPVSGDCAKADITHSWAGIVIHLFSAMFQSSSDLTRMIVGQVENEREKPRLATSNTAKFSHFPWDIKVYFGTYKGYYYSIYIKIRGKNHLIASNNQESGVAWMKNTGMKLVPTGNKFMNAVSWCQWPHSDRFLADRGQEISIHIPTNGVYLSGVTLIAKEVMQYTG